MTPHLVLAAAELAVSAEIPWRPFRPGVDQYPLLDSAGDGAPSAALLRYRPGARVPHHEHSDLEHVFVLAGAQEDEHGRYPAGTWITNSPGSSHSVHSPEGCVVLVLWKRPVRFG
jgi:anti-sigma factor ChrR (cupin superfamily)